MKITFDFGNGVIVLPRDAVWDNLRSASREELCVLLSAAADPSLGTRERAKLLGISEGEVSHALAFWRGAGVIGSEGGEKVKKSTVTDSSPKRKKNVAKTPEKAVPHYTSTELADAVNRPEFRSLLEHCQQILGRVFNAGEAEKVVGICEYLSVSPDFVALLCSHLAADGKTSLRTLEKSAMDFYDRGICDFEALSEYIELCKKSRTLEGKVRTLFGIGKRSLTGAEKKYIESWAKSDLSFGMLEYAYELTVNATGEAPMKYTNTIIESWIAKGYSCVEDAKKGDEEFRKKKTPAKRSRKNGAAGGDSSLSSFDSDDFFEAAMRRSYGEEGAICEEVESK